MKITVKKQWPEKCVTDVLVVCHFEGEPTLRGAAKELDEAGGGILSSLITAEDFTGKSDETALVYTQGMLPARRILMVGLGKKHDISLENLRVSCAGAARRIRTIKVKNLSLSVDFGSDIVRDRLAAAAVEGMLLGLYRFTPFKTKSGNSEEITSITFLEDNALQRKAMTRAIQEARIICEAVTTARDLVSTPSNEMTPSIMAEEARRLGRTKPIAVKIIEASAMKRMGMNALLGVGRGSCHPPKLIVMNYGGMPRRSKPLVLVGKGITFDSGGISLKPSENMSQMKDDMAGGAAVMGTMKAVAELGLPVNLVGLVPVAENLPDGCSYKPGDVLRSLSGQTIEVTNTDAEGRLILADALTFAQRFKPAAIIDIATLTGACVIALGDYLTGMLGNDKNLKNMMNTAAEMTGESLWELPLWDEYDDLLSSDVADMKNSGTRAGSTITAALFLKKFVGDCPWVHLDIAGPSFLAKDKGYIPKGASGIGVRLLVQFLKIWTRQQDEPDS